MTGETACFHCGEAVTTGRRYLVAFDDGDKPACCPGCKAVAEFIRDAGLAGYYDFRTADAPRPEAPEPDAIRAEWLAYDRPQLQASLTVEVGNGRREILLLVEGVRCAACSWLIERAVGTMDGVEAMHVNPATARARLVWDPEQTRLSRVMDAVARLGYRPHPVTAATDSAVATRERRQALKRLAVAGLGMMQVMTYAVSMYAGAFQGMDEDIRAFLRLVSLVVATPVVLYSGFPFFVGAWRDIRAGRPGMDVPVALAIGAAYAASLYNGIRGSGEVYFDSVTMFVFFLSLGRFAEMAARHRAGSMSDALARFAPATALRLEGRPAEPITVGVAELAVGDRLLVRSGDAFPADGRLCRGSTHVDEAMLTGESRPVPKSAGDRVIGGSVNTGDPVEVVVERTGADTVLSHVGRLLERAQTSRPVIARTADVVARWFVVGVLVIAAVVAAIWSSVDPAAAFEVTLAVLVVTCPCALSLATPTALTAATSGLAGDGLLVSRSDVLESLAGADRMVLDKTGTLTRAGCPGAAWVRRHGRMSAVAAALERESEHPLATAGVFPGPRRLRRVARPVSRARHGTLSDRHAGFVSASPAAVGGQRTMPRCSLAEGGGSRPSPSRTLKPGVRPCRAASWGSNSRSPAATRGGPSRGGGGSASTGSGGGRRLKTSWTNQELQRAGHRVIMVGDGINDAPVLAGADVSVAMGAGAPLAQTSADMILLGESLAPLAMVSHCPRTLRVIRQNITWAVLYNLTALPLAAAGFWPPGWPP